MLFEVAGKLLSGTPALVSWLVTLVGTCLVLLPVLAAALLARKIPGLAPHRWLLFGAALGAAAYPLSFWLYLHHFLDPVRSLFLGQPGLALIRWHCLPFAGLPSLDAQTGRPVHWYLSRTLLAPVFWTAAYGLVGALADGWIRRRALQPQDRDSGNR